MKKKLLCALACAAVVVWVAVVGSCQNPDVFEHCIFYTIEGKVADGKYVPIKSGYAWGIQDSVQNEMTRESLQYMDVYREAYGFQDIIVSTNHARKDLFDDESKCRDESKVYEDNRERCWQYKLIVTYIDGRDEPVVMDGPSWCSKVQMEQFMEDLKKWALSALMVEESDVTFKASYEPNDKAINKESCVPATIGPSN